MRHILKSLYHGFAGLTQIVRSEWNMRFHLAAATCAVSACVWLRVPVIEWALVLIVIALVLSAECINTGIERLADRVCEDEDPLIKQCKDAASGGVLVMSILAVIVGAIIFVPRLLEMFTR